MKPKKTRKYSKIIFALFLSIVVLVIVLYFSIFAKNSKIEPNTFEVKTGDITELVKATGEVYASEIVSVGAQVSGQVQKLYIRLGQPVKKDELIAEIDSTTQLDKLNTSKAQLESAKAELAAQKIALQTAQQDYQRKLTLYQAEAGSKEEMEQSKNALKQAQANVETKQFQIKQLQINVNTVQTELGYTQIRAPLSGTVVSLPVEAGQTINFAQTTPLIATIANLDKMEIRMQIAEGDYTKLKVGMPVRFSTLADPKIKLNGKIQKIDPALISLTKGTYDNKSENANSAVFYYARMTVDNKERKLSIGMTTQNDIIIHQKNNVIMIPKTTVMSENETSSVFVYTPNKKTEKRQVKTGVSDFNHIEIMSGLKAGEKILMEFPDDSEKEAQETSK